MLKLVRRSGVVLFGGDFALVEFQFLLFGFEGTIYEGTSNVQLNTIAKMIDQEFKQRM